MYKVHFSFEYEEDIQAFLSYLREYYSNLYSDTGIFYEDEIIQNYIDKFDDLYDEIKAKITTMWSSWLLGYKPLKSTKKYELVQNTFRLNSYIFTFESKKVSSTESIFIERIYITKK